MFHNQKVIGQNAPKKPNQACSIFTYIVYLLFGALRHFSISHHSCNMLLSPNATDNSAASSPQSSSGPSSNRRASPAELGSGRSTPTVLQSGTVDGNKPEKGNGGKTGHEKSAVAYSAKEHVALLKLLA